MSSIDGFTQRTEGPLKLGTVLKFNARGKERETRVTALEPDKRLALTPTQGVNRHAILTPFEG